MQPQLLPPEPECHHFEPFCEWHHRHPITTLLTTVHLRATVGRISSDLEILLTAFYQAFTLYRVAGVPRSPFLLLSLSVQFSCSRAPPGTKTWLDYLENVYMVTHTQGPQSWKDTIAALLYPHLMSYSVHVTCTPCVCVGHKQPSLKLYDEVQRRGLDRTWGHARWQLGTLDL